MEAVDVLAVDVGTKPACEALDLSRATFYRRKAGRGVAEQCFLATYGVTHARCLF